MNRCIVILCAMVCWAWGAVLANHPVLVDFFYEPGCHDCDRIEQELLLELGKRFPESCVVQRYDIGVETNFLYLLQLEDELGYKESERGYLVVNKQVVFGADPSREEVSSLISRLLESDQSIKAQATACSPELVEKRYSRFTWTAVVTAGLIDGINPCAISTLVFFMSLLAVSKVQNQQLILLGAAYVMASFFTYLALGFGLFRTLHLLSGFTALRCAIEWGMAVILLIFSALSLRDAVRFQKTGRATDVTLQLSTGMKKRIHHVMRRGLNSSNILVGGLLIGLLVTALESVCTGQVYVPTLVLILKHSAFSEKKAWFYLLVYNLMFVLPLIAVFSAVYCGLHIKPLMTWSRRNVVVSKYLLTIFFLVMAALVTLL